MIQLKPAEESNEEFEKIEKKIIELFRRMVYLPLIKEFGKSSKTIKNALPSLVDALRSGRITFNRGIFSGSFNSKTSKELQSYGAKFDRKEKAWKIPLEELPIEIRLEISASFTKFQQKIAKIDEHLAGILPEELASQLKIEKLFDDSIYKTDKSVLKTLRDITVQPQLTIAQRKQIAEEWQGNMDLWIKDFTEKEIKRLRGDISKSVFAGNRYGSAISAIKESYGVTERKAKFLARQETKLLTVKLKEIRYVDAGITKYKWRSVAGTALHPVRPRHKELNDESNKGTLFDFRNPPVSTGAGEPTRRNNPGTDFGCRCVAIPVLLQYK